MECQLIGDFIKFKRSASALSTRTWYMNEYYHRIDGGPAIEYNYGYCAWWKRGTFVRGK